MVLVGSLRASVNTQDVMWPSYCVFGSLHHDNSRWRCGRFPEFNVYFLFQENESCSRSKFCSQRQEEPETDENKMQSLFYSQNLQPVFMIQHMASLSDVPYRKHCWTL
ncbi:hypothetical protein XENORESO_014969 [Xenotaenia resolanae]|uniref:Uncharacterized protein n=1 Tax=Xenotaenia resolanae TaxID=208358 RepID=A0ABV0X8P9_9TELE